MGKWKDQIPFLVIIGVELALIAWIVLAPPFSASTSNKLSLNNPARLATQITVLLNKYARNVKADPAQLQAYANEIVPWFAEEGITTDPITATAQFEQQIGTDANHVLGYTFCTDRTVKINIRYSEKIDPWYGDPDLVFTLAHELGHVQQADNCQLFPSELVETSAQMMAFEVTSAIANGGNVVALVSVLENLRDLALAQVRYQALLHPSENKAMYKLYRKLFAGRELAERLQRVRYWAATPDEAKDLLKKYDVAPYRLLKSRTAHGIMLGSEVHAGNPFAGPRPLLLDDFHYVLQHAEAMLANSGGAQ
ncbi:MAG TPA: hypothetical protein VIY48_05800 [Candidatus Paceibacterota bacterium]